MAQDIRLDSAVRASDRQLSCDLEGEAVMLQLDRGAYYGLDEVGAHAWRLIQGKPLTVTALRGALLDEYDVDAATLERDLLDLLGRMEEAGLIEVTHASKSA